MSRAGTLLSSSGGRTRKSGNCLCSPMIWSGAKWRSSSPPPAATRCGPQRAATSTIPIISVSGFDLVKYGLAASLNRPGGNITGFTALSGDLVGKQVGLLRELLPYLPRSFRPSITVAFLL
jgi:ABC transporter substrate binding protein